MISANISKLRQTAQFHEIEFPLVGETNSSVVDDNRNEIRENNESATKVPKVVLDKDKPNTDHCLADLKSNAPHYKTNTSET